jgi:hypothetical protein
MTTPAHHEIGAHLEFQYSRIAQYMKHRVGDVRRGIQLEASAFNDLVGYEHHIAQHGEQVILQPPDHDAVDEGRRRRVLDLQLDAPGLAHDADLEVAVLLEYRAGILDLVA